MLFELHGLILALHHDARFLRSAGAVDRARAAFERAGFAIRTLALDEIEKSGGSLRCCVAEVFDA